MACAYACVNVAEQVIILTAETREKNLVGRNACSYLFQYPPTLIRTRITIEATTLSETMACRVSTSNSVKQATTCHRNTLGDLSSTTRGNSKIQLLSPPFRKVNTAEVALVSCGECRFVFKDTLNSLPSIGQPFYSCSSSAASGLGRVACVTTISDRSATLLSLIYTLYTSRVIGFRQHLYRNRPIAEQGPPSHLHPADPESGTVDNGSVLIIVCLFRPCAKTLRRCRTHVALLRRFNIVIWEECINRV